MLSQTPDDSRRPRPRRPVSPQSQPPIASGASPSEGAAQAPGLCAPAKTQTGPLTDTQMQNNALAAMTQALRQLFPEQGYKVRGRFQRSFFDGGRMCALQAIVSASEQATAFGIPLPWKRKVGVLSVKYEATQSPRGGLQVGWLHFHLARFALYERVPEIADAIRDAVAKAEVGGYMPSGGWSCVKPRNVR